MLKVLVGTDITHIPKVEKLLRSDEAARKVFHPAELEGGSEHAAGVFAAKEAFFKALGMAPDWLAVEVRARKSGAPALLADKRYGSWSVSLSISHDGEYAVAVVLLKGK